jgi:upstream activation factor subunit UAF30
VEASYATIIDSILASSDINTISAKQIRKGLQQAVDYDLEPQKVCLAILCQHLLNLLKDLIKALIIARFDKFNNAAAPAKATTTSKAATNGTSHAKPSQKPRDAAADDASVDMKSEGYEEDEMSDVVDSPKKSPKKKRKTESIDNDAKLAAKLQALENTKARSTRGGGTKKATPIKKKKASKSKTRLKAEDDSEIDSEVGEERKRKVNRNGGFHVRESCSIEEATDNPSETFYVVCSTFKSS